MGSTTPRQLAVLVAVSEQEEEGLNQTEVVERTGIDRSALAEIIRRLVRKGLLHVGGAGGHEVHGAPPDG